jgi:flagellar hook-length control protein FliK
MQGRGSSARELEEDVGAMSTGRKQREQAKEAAARAAFVTSGKKARARKTAATDVSGLCLDPTGMWSLGCILLAQQI